jgi:hypothetical protein
MSSDFIPVNQAVGTEIEAGQKATFEFEPDASGMKIDVVAASKYRGLTYTVKVDDEVRFGPAPIPPTDIDDLSTTHNPRLPVDRHLKIKVQNPSVNDRFVSAQLRGIEQ